MPMAMAWIWTGMAAVSLIFAAWNGTMDAVGAAALEGAGAAVQLVECEAASAVEVAAGFGVGTVTVWRWRQARAEGGVAGLVPAKTGPKGPSKVTDEVAAQMVSRRAAGETLEQVAQALGVSEFAVRQGLKRLTRHQNSGEVAPGAETTPDADPEPEVEPSEPVLPVLPVLPEPVSRTVERGLARAGLLEQARPVFHPAARVPLAGLFLALPALEATGLRECAHRVYGDLPAGFYGLDSMLVEGVLRCLVGEPRAEGATRIDPHALGRVLGLDRAPEVKTIRRKISHLASQNIADQLLAALARHQVARHQADVEAGVVLYVDGHVRAYQGTRKIAKTHAARLRFPAPAT